MTPRILNRPQCPLESTWDFEPVYPLAQRRQDREQVRTDTVKLNALANRGSLTAVLDADIAAVLDIIGPTGTLVEDLQTYGILVHSVDTLNPATQRRVQEDDEMTERWLQALERIRQALSTVEEDRLKRLMAGRDLFSNWPSAVNFAAWKRADYSSRLAIVAQERIAQQASQAAALVDQRRQDAVIDHTLRSLYGGGNSLFASAFADLVNFELAEARQKGHGLCYREYMAQKNGVPVTLFERWFELVRSNLSIFKRFLEWNCRYFGHQAVPLKHLITEARVIEKPMPLEQVLEDAITSANVLGSDYTATLQWLRYNRRIDYCPNQGRRPGHSATLLKGEPFVLLNYQSSYQGRRAVSHELAHAVQARLSLSTRKTAFDNARLTHEVLAAVGEFLYFRLLDNRATAGEDRFLVVLCETWRNMLEVFMATLWAEFELSAYEYVESGGVLNAVWLSIQATNLLKRYCPGPKIVDEDLAGVIWPFDVTLFRGPQTRWIYPPAHAAAWRIVNDIDQSGKSAAQKYMDFLREANNGPSKDTLRQVGINLGDDGCFAFAFRHLDELVTRLEQSPYRLVT